MIEDVAAAAALVAFGLMLLVWAAILETGGIPL